MDRLSASVNVVCAEEEVCSGSLPLPELEVSGMMLRWYWADAAGHLTLQTVCC